MDNKPYHHGNLRSALVEAGLELISMEGEETLSLRKAALKCGVSNAAPYAHFNNKDEFIAAIQQSICCKKREKVMHRYSNAPCKQQSWQK